MRNSVGLNLVHGFEVWVNRQFRRIFSDRWAWLQIISDLVLRFGPFLAKEFQSLCFIYIFRFNPNTNPTYIWLINCTLIYSTFTLSLFPLQSSPSVIPYTFWHKKCQIKVKFSSQMWHDQQKRLWQMGGDKFTYLSQLEGYYINVL